MNGARVATAAAAFRPGHLFGNRLLTGTVAVIFGDRLKDMLSGYRVMSRRFIKSFPALASGFETETELTVHALELRLPIAEVQTPYRDRPAGSLSKLRTFRDGWRILRTIFFLVKEERPLQFFSAVALALVDRRARARLAAGHRVPRDRPRAALPDGDPGDRPDDPRAS